MSAYDDAQTAAHDAASKAVDDAIAAAVATATGPLLAQLTAANTSLAKANADLAAATSDDQAQVATVTQLRAQVTQLTQQVASLEAQISAGQTTPPPASKTAVFSMYAGPMGTDAGQTATARTRCATALGVKVLPADRVYSSTSFGKAAACPSPIVAVSYGQVPALAKGDATVVKKITDELTSLAKKTGQRFDVSADHEVDAKIRKGTYTGAQVKAAAAKLAQIVASIGAPNIRPVMCLTGYVFTLATTDPSHPANYFDKASVGAIALDPYWPSQPTAAAAFDPAWKWASAQGLPVLVWETGFSLDSNIQTLTDAALSAKVQAIISYWKPKAEYVLWFESTKGSNLLEGRPALALWAAAAQGK